MADLDNNPTENDAGKGTAEELLPLVYAELRKLAAIKLAMELPGQTLQPTALVHEAYLRLAGTSIEWSNRGHFFVAAAEAMRRILIEHARAKSGPKKGGHYVRQSLEPDQIAEPSQSRELILLDDSLNILAAEYPRAAQVVKLRYFGGLTLEEVAETLGISPRTADADWAFARAWLITAMRTSDADSA